MTKQAIAKRVLAKAVQKQNYLKFILQVRKFEKFRRLLATGRISPRTAEIEMVNITKYAEAYLAMSGR